MRFQTKPPIPSKRVVKFLNGLDAKTQHSLKNGIEKIPHGDIIPYAGNKEYNRLRIGKYRILFKWIDDSQIFVTLIDSRGKLIKEVYNNEYRRTAKNHGRLFR